MGKLQRMLAFLSPDEPLWAVAIQVGFITLAVAYFAGHFIAAVFAGRLAP